MSAPVPHLSKSRLLAFHQCPRRLWYEVHEPASAKPASAEAQARMDAGTDVGVLARTLYPHGKLIEADYLHFPDALAQTREALADPTVPVLFEAAFEFSRTRVRCDVLVRRKQGWEMWEVKSVLNPKPIHVLDVAIQVYVAENDLAVQGMPAPVNTFGVLHLNRGYVFDGGALDVAALFQAQSCVGHAKGLPLCPSDMIADGLQVVDSLTPPEVVPNGRCIDPYECPFLGTLCPYPEPEELLCLPGIGPARLAALKAAGIQTMEGLVASSKPVSEKQRQVIEAHRTQQRLIRPGLYEALSQILYPRYYLDFETFMPILPRYAGTCPFQTLPFQFSVHREIAPNKEPEHFGYLHHEDNDPRLPLVEALLLCLEEHPNAPIICYSSYESRIIRTLMQELPLYKQRLGRLLNRLVDLLPIVKTYVYDPAFGGSFSIKSVLPALVPDLDYGDLEIADGTTASLKYLEMLDQQGTDPLTAQQIGEQLWQYCRRDTEAMVAVMKALAMYALNANSKGSLK